MDVRRFKVLYLPGLMSGLILCAILWLTLAPQPIGDIEPPLFEGADKLVHAVMFGALAWSMCRDWALWRGRRPNAAVVLIFGCLSALIGTGIEYLQAWMDTGRTFEAADIVADSVGAIGTAVVLVFCMRFY